MNTPLLVPQTAPMPRCAVYCRVSSDERLDQSFNSIDAQKEAVHAFIQSQACEGWIAVGADYDDGGFPGGNMDRPARRPASLNSQRTAQIEAPGACHHPEHHPEHPGRAEQPRCMRLLWFQRNSLPTDWVAQREVVAAFDV